MVNIDNNNVFKAGDVLINPEGMRKLYRHGAFYVNTLVEQHGGEKLLLTGAKHDGAVFVDGIAATVNEMFDYSLPVAYVDPSFKRDDTKDHIGSKGGTQLPNGMHDIAGKVVVLFDTVLYGGWTARATIEEIIDHGRPDRIHFVVAYRVPGNKTPSTPLRPDLVLRDARASDYGGKQIPDNLEPKLARDGQSLVLVERGLVVKRA